MQRRPSKSELLDAVAQFLMAEVAPAVTDKKVSFRVLIAAHLASTVAQELRGESPRIDAELERLQALLPNIVHGDARKLPERERQSALDLFNEQLAIRIRKGALDRDELSKAGQHLKQTLLETLAVVNPRFETEDDLGDEG